MIKYDIKTILIIVLSVLLIGFYIAAQKGFFVDNKVELDKLKTENKDLKTANDTLIDANHTLNLHIWSLDHEVFDLTNKVNESDSIIRKLKKERNGIPTKINGMSVIGVTNAFTKYLDKKK